MEKPMTKASQRRILKALDYSTDLINDGANATDALVKSAEKHQIPAGHIQLMVNALNTGLTNAQRTATEGVLNKSAEFAMADTNEALKRLYPDEVKTAAEKRYETEVSSDYTAPPRWADELEKAAQPVVDLKKAWELDKPKDFEADPWKPVKKALADEQRANHNINDVRLRLEKVRLKVAASMDTLRDYFSTPGHTPLANVKENSTILYGPMADEILGKIADDRKAPLKFAPVDETHTPYATIKELGKLASEFRETKKELKEAMDKRGDALEAHRPFVQSPKLGHSVLAGPSLREKKSYLGMFLRSGLGLMSANRLAGEVAKKAPGVPDLKSELEESDFRRLMDPGHQAELRNIQAEAMLNDLMANDDVIRGYDPMEVIGAFNEISQTLPHASDKKVLMRDLMRKRLSGGSQALDQFVLGDALKAQQSIRDAKSIGQGDASVLSTLGVIDGGRPKA